MESKTKNLVFLGTTGNGKSSTCNFICGKKEFVVGDGLTSQTTTGRSIQVPSLRVNVIDTIGFGDLRMPESHVDDIITQITTNMINFDGGGTNSIDAFVLVTKCTPRATTLKPDIEHLINLFGSVVLKSVVILLITEGNYSEEVIRGEILKMNEVVNILKSQRNDEIKDWFVHWDNFKPKPNQVQNLMLAVSKLRPYVSMDYINSRPEINDRIDKNINIKLNEQRKRIDEDLGKTKAQKEYLKTQLEKRLKQEKEMCKEASDNSAAQFEKIAQLIQDLNKQGNQNLKQLMQDAQEQSRKMQEDILAKMETSNQQSLNRRKEMDEQFQKNNEEFMRVCQELAKKPPQVVYERGGGGNPLQMLTGLVTGLTSFASGVGGLFSAAKGVGAAWTAAKTAFK